ncbi:hypothetical protein LCGC14_2818750, partial [marine sediment metagenome]
KEVSKESAESLRKLVKDLNVIVTGVLDETSVTVDDLINLKEGDVMRLDSKITDDLRITVEGKNKFYGKLGLLGSKKAMQITSYVEERPDASH